MKIIKKRTFARAGLIGNPSDGYNGKTISVIVREFHAEVVLYEWDQIEIIWSQEDRNRFRSIHELAQDVRLHGYYGGVRLVKATIRKFVDYCDRQGFPLHEENFSVRYQTNIPRQVGLAGSSAIIISTLRCLMEFYDIDIPREVQPSLALSVEIEELGIAAGLQDRVIQVYEGAVFMDFDVERQQEIHGYDCGRYESLDTSRLPPLYIAYDTNVGEPTEIIHNDLRSRYNRGESQVVEAMTHFAGLAQQARDLIASDSPKGLEQLIDENFDTRRSICQLPAGQVNMVERARSVGASAKFAGSGGAIIGALGEANSIAQLREALEPIGCRVIELKL